MTTKPSHADCDHAYDYCSWSANNSFTSWRQAQAYAAMMAAYADALQEEFA